MAIIDCDVHAHINSIDDVIPYMPRVWQERFREMSMSINARGGGRYLHPTGALRQDAVGGDGGLAGSDPAFVAEDLLDPFDIETAVLIPLQVAAVAAWTDPVQSAVFVSAGNKFLHERWCQADKRYGLCLTVSPHDAELAAEEIRRYSDTAGAIGVSLPLGAIMMGNKHYNPIYEAAEETAMPILVHPSGAEATYTGCPPVGGGVPRTYAERHALLPHVAQGNLASLIFEGTFNQFPKLRVAFIEWGFSWLPTFLWRMDKEWRNFRSDVPWVDRPPSEYVREFVRFSTQPIDEPGNPRDLWPVLEQMHASETLVFSSDYPHYDNDPPARVSKTLLPADSRDSILYGTARALFDGRL